MKILNSIKKNLMTMMLAAAVSLGCQASQHYVGGDISLLPEYEKAGAIYKDRSGKPIAELLPWLREQGMNAMRVRLFVNPDKYKAQHQNDQGDTKYDPNACQDLEYIRPLCKRIVDDGFDLMLDFHYSDTWADPAKQWTPIDWQGLSDEQLYQKIYDYTKEVLLTLKADGVTPAFIQPGNEITYGMLWGPVGTSNPKKTLSNSSANWDRFATLLKQAIKACNEVCPEAKIILHTERIPSTSVLSNFYTQMKNRGVPYDIIGLSYYPYFHGDLSVLTKALDMLQQNFSDKNIMIVETGYSYKWAVPGSNFDFSNKWSYSDAGQASFAHQLVALLEKYPAVDGLFWWWMEYNAFGTTLSGWYNAPLFDSTTGKVTLALKEICSFATSGINDVEADSSAPTQWYNLQGMPVDKPTTPGIYVTRGKKVRIP